jgi:hypothetical protein
MFHFEGLPGESLTGRVEEQGFKVSRFQGFKEKAQRPDRNSGTLQP